MTPRWRNTYDRVGGRVVLIHVIPINDLRRHQRRPDCWCQPRVEVLEGGARMVVHASADGRELVEQHGVM